MLNSLRKSRENKQQQKFSPDFLSVCDEHWEKSKKTKEIDSKNSMAKNRGEMDKIFSYKRGQKSDTEREMSNKCAFHYLCAKSTFFSTYHIGAIRSKRKRKPTTLQHLCSTI